MTRLIIKLIGLLFVGVGMAQSSYDAEHSKAFGDYLYNTSQFSIASQEYERAIFLAPGDTSTHLMLFKSYCKINEDQKAMQSYFKLTHDTTLVSLMNGFADVYVQQLVNSGRFEEAHDLASKGCCVTQVEKHLLAIYLMEGRWDEAYDFSQVQTETSMHIQFEDLADLSSRAKAQRFKSRGLSGLMSALIPGSGKVYCGYWQDGIISFLMTSLSGYMAVRSYNKYGINNGYTWFSGALAMGYYGGNIYGGYRSARRYNEHVEHSFKDEAKDIYNRDL